MSVKKRGENVLRERIKKEVMIFDGGMGTQLQQAGMKAGEIPAPRAVRVCDMHPL